MAHESTSRDRDTNYAERVAALQRQLDIVRDLERQVDQLRGHYLDELVGVLDEWREGGA